MKKFLLITAVVMISFAFLHADVYIKQQTNTGAVMGQPARQETQEQWLGSKRIAMIKDSGTTILNLELNKFYMVNHKNKTYIEADLPLDWSKLVPEQMAGMMKGMMEGMTIAVTPNGQTKKVLDFNADGYDAKMTMMGMDMKMTFWASKDVPFDWKKYSEDYSEFFNVQFKMGEKFMQEFKKIQGFPLETEVSMMGVNVTTKTIEINANKQPGPDTYSVPAGYTKKDKMSMQDMQQR